MPHRSIDPIIFIIFRHYCSYLKNLFFYDGIIDSDNDNNIK